MKNKLWSKNFTILTAGTVISMFGSSITWFTLGLLVFDQTQSTFLYSLVAIAYQLPSFILPLLVGSYLDRFSRRKMIYLLDFLNGFLFVIAALLLYLGYANYPFILLLTLVVGSVGCFYNIAYESFYPNLIPEGQFQKAYSISSVIYPLTSALMMPIAAVVYENYGAFPLLAFNAISFILAAIMEVFIDAEESHIQTETKVVKVTVATYLRDIKEGLAYVMGEKGLWAVTIYFGISMMMGSITQNLYVPFFSTTPGYNIEQMAIVMSFSSIGRLIGGIVHYFVRYPKKFKYAIAIFVYSTLAILEVLFFFSPYQLGIGSTVLYPMCMIMLVFGMLGITSFNIRVSATQSYVPDSKRGRFNGVFSMVTNTGGVIGSLIAGFLGSFISVRVIVLMVSVILLIAIFVILVRNQEAVKHLYNREV